MVMRKTLDIWCMILTLLIMHQSDVRSQPSGAKVAYVMTLGDNWDIRGGLPTSAFLISLQGLANQGAPRLYFIYPKKWPYGYTSRLKEYYEATYGFRFDELKSPAEALHKFLNHVEGYVVWDTSMRTSLTVAFTVAGLRHAVVVSPDQIGMVQQEGLQQLEDFRGRFQEKSDYEIYLWALDQYWNECSHEFLTYMGGVAGKSMQPGIADFGIYHRAFFTDLSCDPRDTLEYALADSIMGRMTPLTSFVLGWHSYAKDLEQQYITLISKHVLRQEGLNTWPNMSFTTQLPMTEGFTFKNRHNVVPGRTYSPEKKIYVACVQTDGLGLGAWLDPERGTFPYAWEVADGNSITLAPALFEYFYKNATPNDYFIGALSGPSYMYPWAIPSKFLPRVIAMDRELMKKLDLRIYGIMERTHGGDRYIGNTNLPKHIVDAYYDGLPEAIGFIFGYGPGHTFDCRNRIPFLSYDYYLSPGRPAEDVIADLKELAVMNPQRPYFLTMHVRESSGLGRVGDVLKQLGPEFKVVPLDVLVKMAGKIPTYKTRFLDQ
jgi:GxGYxYP putative glycoside hydrolase C-terminal domain/GxGYxYP_N second domain/GxGYxYP third domain/GxGYxYP_N 1st domain